MLRHYVFIISLPTLDIQMHAPIYINKVSSIIESTAHFYYKKKKNIFIFQYKI